MDQRARWLLLGHSPKIHHSSLSPRCSLRSPAPPSDISWCWRESSHLPLSWSVTGCALGYLAGSCPRQMGWCGQGFLVFISGEQSQLSSTRLGTPHPHPHWPGCCHPWGGSSPSMSQGVSRAIFWSAHWLGMGMLWPRTCVHLQSTPGSSVALEEPCALQGISLKWKQRGDGFAAAASPPSGSQTWLLRSQLGNRATLPTCQENTCRETSHALYLGAGRAQIDADPHRLTRHQAHGEMLGAPSSLCFQLPVASASTTGNQEPPAQWEPLQANTVGLCCDKPLLNSHKAACLPSPDPGQEKHLCVLCRDLKSHCISPAAILSHHLVFLFLKILFPILNHARYNTIKQ